MKLSNENIKAIAALIGAVAGVLLGPINGLLFALLALMALDYLTGLLVGIVKKNINSSTGFIGLARKIIILALIALANLFDIYVVKTGAPFRSLVIMFYIANESISIVENAGKLGVPVPRKLKNALEQLKEEDTTDQ